MKPPHKVNRREMLGVIGATTLGAALACTGTGKLDKAASYRIDLKSN